MHVDEARSYCRSMLPHVSRTFALNIRLLPGSLGDAVTLAYLFCRMADTVEDSPHIAEPLKSKSLEDYSKLFPLRNGWLERVDAWTGTFDGLEDRGADHTLCRNAAAVFTAFEGLGAQMRGPVETCVQEMALGMRRFVERRSNSPALRLQLESLADLEEYCHYVAGTVGEMLCRLFAQSSRHLHGERLREMQRLAGRFGLAMQLTNIIKDVADDAERGACYVPRTLAACHGLSPEEILDPAHRVAARSLVQELASHAARALDAALRFTLIIPRREVRMRLFCLWPLFLAARTLSRVLHDDTLFVPGARPRLNRDEVRRCLRQTSIAVFSNRALQRLYESERRRMRRCLEGAAAAEPA